MDKRIQKTINAIYAAFAECLKEKDFADLSVEDILQKAHISRSTFYAHFKTKGDVLDSVLRNIFNHVFSHALEQEESHDFSHASILDYEHLFTHTLYHLRDEKELIQSILATSCKTTFLAELRAQIEPLVLRCIREGFFERKDVPEQLQYSHITESFLTSVTYWFATDCQNSPEELVAAFLCMNK